MSSKKRKGTRQGPVIRRADQVQQTTTDQRLLQGRGDTDWVHSDPWRVMRIQAEFVEGFGALATLGPAVSIFGSARTQPGDFAYVETRRLAAALAGMGCDIITGGGPGLMQAANEGAASVPGAAQSVGIRIELPFEQDVNAFVTEAFEHRTFFTRLHQFVLQSDAFVVAPGGIGTVLESMLVWQLLQVRHLERTPLIFVGKMWPGLVAWAREAMLATTPPLASREDLEIPRCVPGADEALAIIGEHHGRWLADATHRREPCDGP